jgi:RNA polymerase sigma-70 factor (ECF subfamily)
MPWWKWMVMMSSLATCCALENEPIPGPAPAEYFTSPAENADLDRLNDLFARCMPRLEKTARRVLRNAHDSEDALQDGLLLGFRNLSKFEKRAQFSTWMHTIVVNAARTILKRQKYRLITASLDEPFPDHDALTLADVICDSRESVEESYNQVERLRLLQEIVRRLPPVHRSIICLCDLECLSIKDAAKRLGISVAATKTRHLRATRFLLQMGESAREKQAGILDLLAEHAQRSERSKTSRRLVDVSRVAADRSAEM